MSSFHPHHLPLRTLDDGYDGPEDDLDELDLLHSTRRATPPGHITVVTHRPHTPLRQHSYDPALGSGSPYEDYPLSQPSEDKDQGSLVRDSSDQALPISPTLEPKPHPSIRHQPPRHGKGVLLVGGLALVGLAYLIMFTATQGTRYGHAVKVNVILMISDGFGPASETFAREFVQHLQSLPPEEQQAERSKRWIFPENLPSEPLKNSDRPEHYSSFLGTLPLDPLLIGSSRTRSSDSLITDSAAGATAFACGIKTYNGAIAVEPFEQKPCGTVLEAAKHRGYLTGVVATSRITHATPASFYAHVVDRDMESDIAGFLVGTGPLGRSVDLAFGGGARFFKKSANSSTADQTDLLELAQSRFGFTIYNSTQQFEDGWNEGVDNGNIKIPVLGLFNDDHMKYEIDRLSETDDLKREPSLRNMSLAALQTLSKTAKSQSAHGFFLMIEGSRIDMAAHSNDPIGHLYDILAYQETVRTVKTWVDEANKAGWPTVMISVSDHETGGLTLGRQLSSTYPVYAWYPEVLLNSTHSTEFLSQEIHSKYQQNRLGRELVINEIFKNGLGIQDYNEDEIEKVLKAAQEHTNVDYLLADMISRRAQLGWSTHGHSGVDVNLYGHPKDLVQDLTGSRENVEVGSFIVETMQIDLEVVNKDLNRLAKSWHKVNEGQIKSNQHTRTHPRHYAHEF